MTSEISNITHFYAFHHSETFRNKKGEEIQGWINDEEAQLTQEGRDAAGKLGSFLLQQVPSIAAVISSDLTRASDTAMIVADHYLETQRFEFYTHRGLKEKCHGPWDTMSVKTRNEYCLSYYSKYEEELRAKNDRFAKWKIEPLTCGEIVQKLPNCTHKIETIYEVFIRGTAAFKELGERYAGKNILISSHGAFLDIMATEAESRQKGDNALLPVYFESKARHFPKNGAIYHFTWDSAKQELCFVECKEA